MLIERGVAPTVAAAIISTFSLMSAVASLACGFLPRWLPIRYPMALIGVFLTLATLLMVGIASAGEGYVAVQALRPPGLGAQENPCSEGYVAPKVGTEARSFLPAQPTIEVPRWPLRKQPASESR